MQELTELQDGIIKAATEHIKRQNKKNAYNKFVIACITSLLIILIVCATVVGCVAIVSQQQTIVEQQYALNMQYSSLMEYIAGAEVITCTAESNGDGSIPVAGNDNITVGGDVVGQ